MLKCCWHSLLSLAGFQWLNFRLHFYGQCLDCFGFGSASSGYGSFLEREFGASFGLLSASAGYFLLDLLRKIDFKLCSWEKRKRFGPWPTLYSSSHLVGLLSYPQ